jgi:hypothetical protein
MIKQSKPSPQDDQSPPPVSPTNDVEESPEVLPASDATLRARTYTVASQVQVHAPQKSLGRYVKAR